MNHFSENGKAAQMSLYEIERLLRPLPWFRRFCKRIFEIYCLLLFKLYVPLRVSGRENLPKSSFIFCSNHCSHLDTGVLMLASGLSFEHFGMMAATDYFFNNKLRRVFLGLLMDLIPVDRKISIRSMKEMLRSCRLYTSTGERHIIMYPEGTRSTSGQLQRLKSGAAMVAAELNLPIVPAYIEGTQKAMPKGRSLMKPARLYARIGEPIYPDRVINSHKLRRKTALYRLMTKELEERILNLKENGRAA